MRADHRRVREEQAVIMANKIIISCAITGSIHTPTMSDALPITPDQIATQAIDAAHAGAAILHLHARDPRTAGRRPIQTCSCSSCRGSSRPAMPW